MNQVCSYVYLIFIYILCLYENQLRLKYGMTFSSQKDLFIYVVANVQIQLMYTLADRPANVL